MPDMSDVPQITRRLTVAALAGLVSACSPLGAMNALAPRDRGARRVGRDLIYGPDARQRFDLYAPTEAGDWPVVVFFHGGGWDSGSKDLYGWVGQAIAANGFLAAVPSYRLVPQVVFPTFVEDAARATAAVAQLAGGYGGRSDRLAVMGHSAGAHLALMITLDRRYMAGLGQGDLIRAAVGLSGPYDFLPLDVPASINAFGTWAHPDQTQPIHYARGDAPTIWLGHGRRDVTVHAEDSERLAQTVLEAGGRAELALYPDLDHAGTIACFSPLLRGQARVLSDCTNFLRRTLG